MFPQLERNVWQECLCIRTDAICVLKGNRMYTYAWFLKRAPTTHLHENPLAFIKERDSCPPPAPQIHCIRITGSLFMAFRYPFAGVDEISLWWTVAVQTYHIIQPCSELGTYISRTRFLSLWLVTTGEGLFVQVPCEQVGQQCWEWLVRGPGRPEIRGAKACSASRARQEPGTCSARN